MYLSIGFGFRREFSRIFTACCSSVRGRGGSRPRRPNASRSASVNAVPLLSAGSCKRATPFSPAGTKLGRCCFPALALTFFRFSVDCWLIPSGGGGREADERGATWRVELIGLTSAQILRGTWKSLWLSRASCCSDASSATSIPSAAGFHAKIESPLDGGHVSL